MEPVIKFNASEADAALIALIAQRACNVRAWANRGIDKLDLELTITAVHLNDCALDLQQLLEFEQFDFTYDILGMLRHIDRETGKLNDSFLPRCAKPENEIG